MKHINEVINEMQMNNDINAFLVTIIISYRSGDDYASFWGYTDEGEEEFSVGVYKNKSEAEKEASRIFDLLPQEWVDDDGYTHTKKEYKINEVPYIK